MNLKKTKPFICAPKKTEIDVSYWDKRLNLAFIFLSPNPMITVSELHELNWKGEEGEEVEEEEHVTVYFVFLVIGWWGQQ